MTPDIRERAERLAEEVFATTLAVSTTNSGEKRAIDLISQALTVEREAGRAEGIRSVLTMTETYTKGIADNQDQQFGEYVLTMKPRVAKTLGSAEHTEKRARAILAAIRNPET